MCKFEEKPEWLTNEDFREKLKWVKNEWERDERLKYDGLLDRFLSRTLYEKKGEDIASSIDSLEQRIEEAKDSYSPFGKS